VPRSVPAVRRPATLTGQLGFTERIFVRGEDRQVATAVDDGLALVEEALHREMRFADNLADVTTRYLLEAGGKRVRPMLTLLTAQLGKGNTPEVVQAAQAVEITHLASLYHDDVMDDSQMRRGVPTAQFVWGNSVAVLTGDLLFARASSRPTRSSGSVSGSCTRRSGRRRARMPSPTTSGCSRTRPVR
jgi:heptaprenyl diphosphate synthase